MERSETIKSRLSTYSIPEASTTVKPIDLARQEYYGDTTEKKPSIVFSYASAQQLKQARLEALQLKLQERLKANLPPPPENPYEGLETVNDSGNDLNGKPFNSAESGRMRPGGAEQYTALVVPPECNPRGDEKLSTARLVEKGRIADYQRNIGRAVGTGGRGPHVVCQAGDEASQDAADGGASSSSSVKADRRSTGVTIPSAKKPPKPSDPRMTTLRKSVTTPYVPVVLSSSLVPKTGLGTTAQVVAVVRSTVEGVVMRPFLTSAPTSAAQRNLQSGNSGEASGSGRDSLVRSSYAGGSDMGARGASDSGGGGGGSGGSSVPLVKVQEEDLLETYRRQSAAKLMAMAGLTSAPSFRFARTGSRRSTAERLLQRNAAAQQQAHEAVPQGSSGPERHGSPPATQRALAEAAKEALESASQAAVASLLQAMAPQGAENGYIPGFDVPPQPSGADQTAEAVAGAVAEETSVEDLHSWTGPRPTGAAHAPPTPRTPGTPTNAQPMPDLASGQTLAANSTPREQAQHRLSGAGHPAQHSPRAPNHDAVVAPQSVVHNQPAVAGPPASPRLSDSSMPQQSVVSPPQASNSETSQPAAKPASGSTNAAPQLPVSINPAPGLTDSEQPRYDVTEYTSAPSPARPPVTAVPAATASSSHHMLHTQGATQGSLVSQPLAATQAQRHSGPAAPVASVPTYGHPAQASLPASRFSDRSYQQPCSVPTVWDNYQLTLQPTDAALYPWQASGARPRHRPSSASPHTHASGPHTHHLFAYGRPQSAGRGAFGFSVTGIGLLQAKAGCRDEGDRLTPGSVHPAGRLAQSTNPALSVHTRKTTSKERNGVLAWHNGSSTGPDEQQALSVPWNSVAIPNSSLDTAASAPVAIRALSRPSSAHPASAPSAHTLHGARPQSAQALRHTTQTLSQLETDRLAAARSDLQYRVIEQQAAAYGLTSPKDLVETHSAPASVDAITAAPTAAKVLQVPVSVRQERPTSAPTQAPVHPSRAGPDAAVAHLRALSAPAGGHHHTRSNTASRTAMARPNSAVPRSLQLGAPTGGAASATRPQSALPLNASGVCVRRTRPPSAGRWSSPGPAVAAYAASALEPAECEILWSPSTNPLEDTPGVSMDPVFQYAVTAIAV